MRVLDTIFSGAADAVFAIDRLRRIVYHNEAFANIFGRALATSPRRRCYEIVRGRTLDGRRFCNSECSVAKALFKHQPVNHFDLTVHHTSGESRWFCVGCFPIPRISGEAVAVCMLRPVNVFKVLSQLAEAKDGSDASQTGGTSRLTPRERQILSLLAEGYSTRAVSQALHISYVTARKHIQNILKKLGVHSMAEAVSYAYRNYLI